MGQKLIMYSRRDFLKTVGKSAGAAAYLKWVAPLVPIIGASEACKGDSPTSPEKEFLNYRTAEVTYTRNPDNIHPDRKKTGIQYLARISYGLYDPEGEGYKRNITGNKEYYKDGYRLAEKLYMKSTDDENKFTFNLKDLLIQTDKYNEDHWVYVIDKALWDGLSPVTAYTSDDIDIAGAYAVRLSPDGWMTYFKMSSSGNLQTNIF
jgi:hypothetical protein